MLSKELQKKNQEIIKENINEKNIFFSSIQTSSRAIGGFTTITFFQKSELDACNLDLIHFLSTEKHSPSIFKKGKRNNDSWFCASAIPFDCDGGDTIENVITILDSLKCSYFIVPSKNHQKEKNGVIVDRFHFFVIPNKPITVRSRYQQYVNFFITKIKCDKAVKDFARYFNETPNLIKIEKIVFNEEFDKNFKWESSNETRTQTKISKLQVEEIYDEPQKNFVEQVNHIHPELIYSHFNKSNNSMNFYRNSNDEGPGLFVYPDSKMITDPSNNTHKPIMFSLQNFNEVRPVKDNMIDFLKAKIPEILESKKDDDWQIDIIKTNEGTGKSYAVCQLLERGMFFTANTLERLKEIEKTLAGLGKYFAVIYSNANLIYNTVKLNRGDTVEAKQQAEEMIERYENFFKKNNNNKENSRPEFGDERNQLVKQKIAEFLKNAIKNTPEEDSNSIEEGISIGKFLESEYASGDIKEDEIDMILSEYNNQIDMIKCQDRIYLMTTQKFFYMKNLILEFSQKVVCFQDECLIDIYKTTKLISNKDKNYATLCCIAKMKNSFTDQDYDNLISMESDEKFIQVLQAVKEGRAEYFLPTSYGSFVSLIKREEINWYKDSKFHFIILTTEDLPEAILPNAILHDFTHRILSPKLTFIGIDGLNSTKNESFIFQGKDRLLFIKQLVMDRFKIEDDMIIANAIDQKWNFVNSKGTNKFKDALQNFKGTKKLAIILTYPHPEQINEKKGFYLNDIERDIKKMQGTSIQDALNSDYCEQYVINKIINDDLNQALGRVLGYRNTDKISEVLVFLNISLFPYISSKYVTTNVFTYTGMYQNKKLRDENPILWEFLQKTQLLRARGKRLTFDPDKTTVAEKNSQVLTTSWIQYIIRKVFFLSEQLANRIKKKIHSILPIYTLQNNFDSIRNYVYHILLKNNSHTARNIKDCIAARGLLGILHEIKGNLKVYYKNDMKFLCLR